MTLDDYIRESGEDPLVWLDLTERDKMGLLQEAIYRANVWAQLGYRIDTIGHNAARTREDRLVAVLAELDRIRESGFLGKR